MKMKPKMDRSNPEWRDVFYEQFSDLQAPSDEEMSGEIVAVKRKKTSHRPTKKSRPSAALGADPNAAPAGDADGEKVDDGHSNSNAEEEVQFLQEVAPVDGKVRDLEAQLRSVNQKLEQLTRATAAREQMDLDDEDVEVKAKLSSLEQRGLYFNILREVHSNLEFPQVQLDGDTDQPEYFSAFKKKDSPFQMPFCQPLLDQLQVMSKPPVRGTRKEPFRLIDRFYQAVHDVENSILKPRFVPSSLLDEVEVKSKSNPGASGEEARLNKDTASGQKELAALRDLKQASSTMRLVNNQEIGLQSISVLSDLLNGDIQGLLAIPHHPPQYDEIFNLMSVRMSSILTVLGDLKLGNTNMARGVLYQYTEAVKDRRQAWVASSKLPQALQSEIIKGPLDVFQPGSDEPLCLLAPKQVQLVQQHIKGRNDNVFRDAVAKFKPTTANPFAKRQNRNQRRKPKQFTSEVSPAAAAAGWGTRGGHNNTQSRGGRKPAGRGRGQPFSASSASNTSK
jgi:hypothetical protein